MRVNMAPGAFEATSGVIDEVGRHETDVADVDAFAQHAVAERRHQAVARLGACRGRTRTPLGTRRNRAKATPMARQHGLVELLGHGPADVIGLEDGVEFSHSDGRTLPG